MASALSRSADLVLDLFQVGQRLFNLGGRQESVAIRDQLHRARLVLDRAMAAGLLRRGDRLAVIGAGAAGTTVALRAAREYGIRTVLFDKVSQPLLAHPYVCRSRWIDPTLYDWPATHWDEQRYPLAEEQLARRPGAAPPPLSWRGNTAALVGADWRKEWMTVAPTLIQVGLLAFEPLAEISNCERLGEGYYLSNDEATISPENQGPFDAVIAAFGRGTERTWLLGDAEPAEDEHAGFAFWEQDPIEEWALDRAGFPVALRHTVALSGGGDGTLQDLVRLIFIDPAFKGAPDSRTEPLYPGALLRAIEAEVRNAASAGTWQALLWRISAAEERARRAYAWVSHDGRRYDAREDGRLLARLHGEYQEAIGGMLGDAPVERAISRVLADWWRDDADDIHFLSRHPYYFSWCYPLNRFFGELLLHLALRGPQADPWSRSWHPPQGGGVTFWRGTAIAGAARPVDHAACAPDACREMPHELTLEHRDGSQRDLGVVDLLLVRHGLTPPPAIPDIGGVATSRHALPFALLG